MSQAPLPFDANTAFMVLCILGVLQGLGTYIALRASMPGGLSRTQNLWMLGNLLAAMMALLIGLRGRPGSVWNLGATHLLMLAWLIMAWTSLRLERGLNAAWTGCVVLALASAALNFSLILSVGEANVSIYPVMVGIVGCLAVCWQAHRLARAEGGGGASLLAFAFALTSFALMMRGFAILTSDVPPTAITAGRSQMMLALGGVSFFVLANLGYLGLQFERLTSERLRAERLQSRAEERSAQAAERTRALESLVDERELLIQRLQRLDSAQQLALVAAALPHELRQPLGALRLNLDSLTHALARHPDPVSQQLLSALDRDVQHLSAMIDDLMALVRSPAPDSAAAGKDVVDVVAVARAALEAITPRARVSGVTLKFDPVAASRAPTLAATNAAMLQQVLLILLANALDVVADLPAPRWVAIDIFDEAGRIQVRVVDNGPGVPDHIVPHLFEPFASHRTGGSGIGLALARRLARRWDADLSVMSNAIEGERAGAVFTIHLDAAGAAGSVP